ncbi:uncharacterized protein LOC133531997 [Cydia pomonella]|uniref:uncharacterized protein LOC133531997 n=1 Tax=Cydia pomonella TaxID=82600 RepID=UPI002ADE0B80|nr:uncharacterized protein LOC133531997 [Cydia pomonella]
MLAKERPKKVRINITTYSKPKRKYIVEMNKTCGSRNENSRFICSICLNSNARNLEQSNLECDKRKSKSCPMCQGTATNLSHERTNKTDKIENKVEDSRIKTVHPPKINVDHGLNLLTEVLTVFQSQKEHNDKEKSRTIVLKDACVAAELGKTKPKLSLSKIFQLSIEGGCVQESGKFCLVNACQPKVATNSQCSIDLIKHKSSSIPQMKMEELKNSLKEKTKTNKDAIEEVNRMFATVKRDDNFDNINRPLVRNGPRVLPVVKTSSEKPSQRRSDEDSDRSHNEICKCCQNNQNYYLSSGDSLAKRERCEKSINVECCNKNHNRLSKEIQVCERCRKPSYGSDY